jgi:hypothetical protein
MDAHDESVERRNDFGNFAGRSGSAQIPGKVEDFDGR